jgi:uncharacterized membrane protein (DUF2068 family)
VSHVKVVSDRPRETDRVVRLIGAFKLLKGLLLALTGLGTLRLFHRDVDEVATNWAWQLHLDPGGRLVGRVLDKVGAVDDRTLGFITAGMFTYSVLLLTEATGLLLRKRWAEYFTIIVTASFIPLELWELVKHVTVLRLSVLVLNALIIWYLAARLRWEHAGEAGSGMPETAPRRRT